MLRTSARNVSACVAGCVDLGFWLNGGASSRK